MQLESYHHHLKQLIYLITSTTIIYSIACTHQQVSFEKDVTPILESNCTGCHTAPYGYGYRKTGLQLNSYSSLMQGTVYGSVIVAGDSQRSILNKLIEGRAGEMLKLMHENDLDTPTQEEITIIRDWVDQGALNN